LLDRSIERSLTTLLTRFEFDTETALPTHDSMIRANVDHARSKRDRARGSIVDRDRTVEDRTAISVRLVDIAAEHSYISLNFAS
jgi:hypothetical protein